MGGLLYKDFTIVRGKRLLIVTAAVTVLLILLRVLFPGTEDLTEFMAYDNQGNPLNLIDVVFATMAGCFMLFGVSLINGYVRKICEADEKNKLREYLFSMPLERKTVVASKYVFIGITAYIFFSLYMILSVSSKAFAGGNQDFMNVLDSFALFFFCIALLLAGIELPMFILMGRGKAMLIKVGIIMLFGMLIIGYVLFGNLEVFSNIDIEKIVSWMNAHSFQLMAMSVIFPAVTLLLYYFSYRLTAALCGRKERNYD